MEDARHRLGPDRVRVAEEDLLLRPLFRGARQGGGEDLHNLGVAAVVGRSGDAEQRVGRGELHARVRIVERFHEERGAQLFLHPRLWPRLAGRAGGFPLRPLIIIMEENEHRLKRSFRRQKLFFISPLP